MTARNRPTLIALAAATLSLVPLAPGLAHADPSTGISVAGTATVKAKPSVVVVQATVVAEAELAADASVKFGDMKKKALATLAGLKNPDLSVEPLGSSVDQAVDPAMQQRMMNGMGGGDAKPKVRVSERLKLTLKNADGMPPEKLTQSVLSLIDTARDAGLRVGPPPPRNWQELQNPTPGSGLVSYEIPDVSALQDQAYKAAMDDARHKAQRLADLSGVKLGRVQSAQDQGAGPSPGDLRGIIYGYATDSAPAEVTKKATSNTLGDIAVTVRVAVQFEIEK